MKTKFQTPVVRTISHNKKDSWEFPVDHYSYSSFTKFSSNPFMFKVNNINGDSIDTTSSASNVLGKALHKAMQTYFGGNDDVVIANEAEAIVQGHRVGLEYLQAYSDGFIDFTTTIPTREVLNEKYAFAYFTYLKESSFEKRVKSIVLVEKMLKHVIEIDGRVLPVPLKGYPDLVYRDKKDRLIIVDHKFTSTYSKEEEIDGAKLIQSAFLYFLVYAETGEAPYSIQFREFKITKNKDSLVPQTKEYEIVFEKIPMMFELFYRFYDDVTNALLGKQVYVPNLMSLFDKEVSIMAYIHRLDIDEERAKKFKEMKVDNITDFLKEKIMRDGSMKKYLETVTNKFISATTLNYKEMKIEERIKMKLAEHGLGVEFHSKIEGGSVTMYRYEPSVGLKMSKIEAYTKDIEQVIEISGIRILAPIRDSGLVGFEVPKKVRTFPTEKPSSDGFRLAIGIDIVGDVYRMDLREAPHMIIAGATGSGKSVLMNNLIGQLTKLSEKDVSLILLDPKMVELGQFKDEKVVSNYAHEIMDIHRVLENLVAHMNRRYKKMQENKVKNLAELREKKTEKYPYVFVFIDEYGDLVMQDYIHTEQIVTGKTKKGEDIVKTIKTNISEEIRKNVLLLSQKARASGIHLILTTQRPSVNVVDGSIKSNFPTRIALKTSSSVDSQVILDRDGAEKLLGKGDMLVMDSTKSDLQRLQGFGE